MSSKSKARPKRFIELSSVSEDMKRSTMLAYILDNGVGMWLRLKPHVHAKYGAFTIAEDDVLRMDSDSIDYIIGRLAFYANTNLPSNAPLDAHETVSITSNNAKQALARLTKKLMHR